MGIWLLILGFAAIAIATWLFLVTLKIPSQSILFSRQYAEEFRGRYTGKFGATVMVANFFGTLTSLATVYIFFLGTSKVFGAYIFAAPLTIFMGYWVTNRFTNALLKNNKNYAESLKSSDTISAVIAKIGWDNDRSAKRLSELVKWISLLSISGVIWLEFSIFADLARDVAGYGGDGILLGAACLFLCATSVIFIIFKYGLRGFVFADLLQGPVVVLGSFILFSALLYILITSPPSTNVAPALFTPLAPPITLALFVVHVLVLNTAFVLVTEGHWFRLWLFDKIEITGQKAAVLTTSLTWALLALIGCMAIGVSTGVGNGGVVDLITKLSELHPLLVFIFWIVGSAALFSTADAQLFHFILVKNFDPKTGQMMDDVNRPVRPLIQALSAAIGMSVLYIVIRYFELPFEKLVFTITPLCANILPSLVASATNRPPPLALTVCSLAIYVMFSAVGLIQPDNALTWTLAAACVPVVCTAIMLATSSSNVSREHQDDKS